MNTESPTTTDPSAGRIVFVDDDRYIRESTRQLMEMEGIHIACFESAVAALQHVEPDGCEVIITDIRMPRMSGLDLLDRVRRIDPEIPVILITGQGDIATAVEAMRAGAWHFIEKPFSNDALVETTRRALERRALTLENRRLRLELKLQNTPGQRIVGNAPRMRELRGTIARLAATDADLLLLGETGSGKDLVARTLHESGPRARGNFVAINCGALPEAIIESELFGHEPGAFTGAGKRRVGKFEHAHGGTVFLDEIESMPPALQVKLLRVLQERTVEPLGANRLVPIDVRVVAATKVDLKDEIAGGRFREDLFYRLNVLTVTVPPLRDRVEDVPLLFQHFVLLAATRHGLEAPHASPEQLNALLAHHWPGNVRELRNAAERFVLLGGASPLVNGDSRESADGAVSNLAEQVDAYERILIEQALSRTRGSITATMALLGTPRKTLYDKMRKHGLDKDRFR